MADYLLKSVLYITPLKKSTLSIFTLHFLFNLLSQKLEKNYAHYILCHIILKLIKCGCASAIENNSKKKSYFSIQLLLLCHVRSSVQVGFVTQNPGCEMPGTKNSASLFRAQSTTFCCYNH